MNQRKKDLEASGRDPASAAAHFYADGAHDARKELFERLLASADDPMTRLWLDAHAKEYGL